MESPTRRDWIAAGLSAAAAARLSFAEAPDDLASLTLKQASDGIRSKKVSPVELTEACLASIKTYNPKINAWITVMRDKALAQAKELEKEQNIRQLPQSTPRYSHRHQGFNRHHRRANHSRQRRLRISFSDRGRRGGSPPESCGRDSDRQVQHARIRRRRDFRRQLLGARSQSVEFGARRRWSIRWLGRRRRDEQLFRCSGNGFRRRHPHAIFFLRCGRIQADLRPRQSARHYSLLLVARSLRTN